MFDYLRTLTVGALVVAAATGTGAVAAQSPTADLDARWFAWLGCWTPTDASVSPRSVTCVVPVEGSRDAEALTIARGTVVARERFDASGRPRAIDGNGCRGMETVNWSATNRRVYLRSDYTCGRSGRDASGASVTLFAIGSSGEWLRVEKVRSGTGAIVSVNRFRPTELSSVLTVSVIRSIESQKRAITTARAAIAAPITAEEVVDAVNNLDGDVVRTWLAVTEQTWLLDGTQLVALQNAGVPAPILQVIGGRVIQPQTAPLVELSINNNNGSPSYDDGAPPGCGPYACPNRYSMYNGFDFAPPYPYPYSPFGFNPFSPFGPAFTTFTSSARANRNGNVNVNVNVHGRKDGHRNWNGNWGNGTNWGGGTNRGGRGGTSSQPSRPIGRPTPGVASRVR
jgi:hypothetical protein